MRIGIDVGGTHTDAVLMQGDTLLASHKAMTSHDVVIGVENAIRKVIGEHDVASIQAVMIGTTQFTNAVVERKQLAEVAAVRLAMPSGAELPPMTDWPKDIAQAIGQHSFMVKGGYLYDGNPLGAIDDDEIAALIAQLKQKALHNIAISAAFSPMNPDQEIMLGEQISKAIPHANITLSHRIGSLGILERENAAILNASLKPFADKVVEAFKQALISVNLTCPMFISQNDGTLMNADFVKHYPALTFASGPTNSLRGAFKLTGKANAIVVDVGGTTSDIGFLQNGFPRESNRVIKVGGIRTNFRMPDIQAVGIGGGSIVTDDGRQIGPESVGHTLLEKALVFGGDCLTASDIAVATGAMQMGDPQKVAKLATTLKSNAQATILQEIDANIEKMKPNSDPVPVILVGGGAALIPEGLSSASELIRPPNAGVANAIGAAIAQIGAEAESMLSYAQTSRQDAIAQVSKQASKLAVDAGADAKSLTVLSVDETAIPYMEDKMTRVRVKVVGNVASLNLDAPLVASTPPSASIKE